MVSMGLKKYGNEIGLRVIDGSICGKYRGFFIRMYDGMGFKKVELKFSPLSADLLLKLDTYITSVKQGFRILSYTIGASGLSMNIHDTVGTMDVIKKLLNEFIDFFEANEIPPLDLCGICGQNIETDEAFAFRGDSTIIGHRACLEKEEEKTPEKEIEELKKSYGMGYLGAFLGMIVGIIPWILISLAGFVAGVAGLILSAAIKIGYEKLGGKNGKPKITAIILFTVLGVLAAFFITTTISIYQTFAQEGITFLEALELTPYNLSLAATDPDIASYIAQNLGLGFLFAALGSWSFIVQAYKDTKAQTEKPIVHTI